MLFFFVNRKGWRNRKRNQRKSIRGSGQVELYLEELGGKTCLAGTCNNLFSSEPLMFELLQQETLPTTLIAWLVACLNMKNILPREA